MKTVYKIVKFDLYGKILYTCQEMPELEVRNETDKNRKPVERFYYKGSNHQYGTSHLWELTSTKKQGAIDPTIDELMPYFADVTEDLPGSYKGLKPKTYRSCQLYSNKSGGYLEFYHVDSKDPLRIAMNSHYYTPINL